MLVLHVEEYMKTEKQGGECMSKVEDTYENEIICIKFCGSCPTYPGIKGDLLFCARGKSSSAKQKAGCNCGMCDVWNKYGLTDFCTVRIATETW